MSVVKSYKVSAKSGAEISPLYQSRVQECEELQNCARRQDSYDQVRVTNSYAYTIKQNLLRAVPKLFGIFQTLI